MDDEMEKRFDEIVRLLNLWLRKQDLLEQRLTKLENTQTSLGR